MNNLKIKSDTFAVFTFVNFVEGARLRVPGSYMGFEDGSIILDLPLNQSAFHFRAIEDGFLTVEIDGDEPLSLEAEFKSKGSGNYIYQLYLTEKEVSSDDSDDPETEYEAHLFLVHFVPVPATAPSGQETPEQEMPKLKIKGT